MRCLEHLFLESTARVQWGGQYLPNRDGGKGREDGKMKYKTQNSGPIIIVHRNLPQVITKNAKEGVTHPLPEHS